MGTGQGRRFDGSIKGYIADDEVKLVPIGPVAEQPIYSDAHVVHQLGETMTMWFMRIPPDFTDRQREERKRAHPGERHGETIAAVTMMGELALKLADSIYRLAGKLPPGEGQQ